MAASAPAVVLIDRALIRALLRYVRRLERQFDLLPPGHPAREAAELFAAPGTPPRPIHVRGDRSHRLSRGCCYHAASGR